MGKNKSKSGSGPISAPSDSTAGGRGTSAGAWGEFDPPYELAGRAFIAVGTWRTDAPIGPPDGYTPMRLFGRQLGILIASDFERPPRELPIRYREVIAAIVVRRGLTLRSLPFDMLLDDPTPVELGRLHYGLPKRLDTSTVVDMDAAHLAASASDMAIRARCHGVAASLFALPLRLSFGLGVRLLTRWIEVLGTADGPARRARIALTPSGVGTSFRDVSIAVGGRELQSLWCQSWTLVSTHLGAPHELDEDSEQSRPEATRSDQK
ncbi:MAG: hypothetical protein BGO98_15130 [Myxococcales bacterium 68-20]|nr:MAG: hypothetical protein BGO98_15130 [Myxococcales bacterium 68-20]